MHAEAIRWRQYMYTEADVPVTLAANLSNGWHDRRVERTEDIPRRASLHCLMRKPCCCELYGAAWQIVKTPVRSVQRSRSIMCIRMYPVTNKLF